MGGLVMTDPFHHYRRPADPGESGGYLALPGRAALLGGPLFCSLIFFYKFCQNYFILLSFLLVNDIESNPGPGSDERVRVLYSNIRGLHASLDELAVARSCYRVFFCAESKVSDRRHLSELHILGFGCPPNRG